MAATSKKKVVSKDELRRLMKEQRSSKTATMKIESPLAKYNNLGQLYCVLCNCQVKSNLLWNAHTQGRTHKENVFAVKNKATQPISKQMPPPATVKRKADGDILTAAAKQSKADSLPDDFFDSSEKQPKPDSLSLAQYSSSSDESEEENTVTHKSTNVSTTAGLPADFFDGGIPSSSTEPEVIETKHTSISETLPEGFFDDPKMDAKVRKVEYRDKMEDEWELFQREMKEQTSVSEQIIQEEDEINTEQREIEEIDGQLHRWTKIDALGKKKDALMENKIEPESNSTEDTSDLDEQEFEEFLDWRSKASLK